MKKTLFVLVVAVVLVCVFATTAMASGRIPNRSSAYLTTIPTPGQAGGLSQAEYDQARAMAGGGVKAAYIRWAEAQATASFATTLTNPAVSMTTVHGSYATTTVKCQVCHSVHKAGIDGTFLLPGPSNGCVVCHGSTATMAGVKKVSSGSSLDNRHGGSCGTLCHTESPHGVGVSEYAAGASALFSDWSDFLTGAALASGVTSLPATGVRVGPSHYTDLEGYQFDKLEVAVYQPQLKGADALAITAPVTAADMARGRAIQTGYLCSTEGCHMNGAFSGVSEDAWFGNWVPYVGASPVLTYSLTFGAGVYNSEDIRTKAIKGHELYSVASGTAAFAASGICKDCHDSTDPRLGGAAQFPHSNATWKVFASGDPDVQHNNAVNAGLAENLSTYGYTKLYNNAAWFLLAGSATQTKVSTNTRRIDAAPTATYAPLTVGMDGACLKCHRTGAAGAESGVGIDY